MNLSRRSLLVGASAIIAAPAIVRAESLMKVRAIAKQSYWMGSSGFYSLKEIVCSDVMNGVLCGGRLIIGGAIPVRVDHSLTPNTWYLVTNTPLVIHGCD